MSDERPPIHLFCATFDEDACLREVRECLSRGWTGMGFKTEQFEQAWSAFTGLPKGLFLNSATAALELALTTLREAHGWFDGDEVITTPITFVSTNHAILHAGMTPVFADVDEQLCLDPASIESRITERTRAVMFVGMGGNVGKLDEVVTICRERGLALVLDAAHMAGTRWAGHPGRHVGPEADATCFSFQAVKNLPTGDAGMLHFRDVELTARARKAAWLGISLDTYVRTLKPGAYKWEYDVETVGHKFNGNAVMAAIALAQLPQLSRDNAYRRSVAATYTDALEGVPGIAVVPHSERCVSSRHLFQIRVEGDRNRTMMHLNQLGVYPGVHYNANTRYAMYRDCPGANSVPRAEAASDSIISLPLHLRLSDADVERVIDAVIEATQKTG